MYIWKTDKLSSEIKENTLTEKDWKQYFLAGAILITLSMYMIQTMPRANMISLMVEGILMIVITIIGINIAFNANQENNGTNFVARITALSFPLSIKIIAILHPVILNPEMTNLSLVFKSYFFLIQDS